MYTERVSSFLDIVTCAMSNMPRFDHTCMDFCQQWSQMWEVSRIAKIVRVCWGRSSTDSRPVCDPEWVNFKLHDYSIGVSLQTCRAARKCYSLEMYGEGKVLQLV